jgi:hypothetical protein
LLSLPTCTIDDLHAAYSPCVDNKRDIVFYTEDEECDPEGFEIPKPIYGRNCSNASCPEGQFYDIKENKCNDCEAGKQSQGFSIVYKDFNRNWPAGFSTSCTGNSNCKKWEAWDTYLTAGVNQPVYISTFLNLSVNIEQRRGQVVFDYICPTSAYTSSMVYLLCNISVIFFILDVFLC